MPAVRIENKCFTDPRFALLGRICKQNRHWAIGTMAAVWSYCTEENAHAVKASTLDAIAEFDNFSAAMVAADLGEELGDGLIRVRGTEGRIEWLGKKRGAGRSGGQASAKQRASKQQADAMQPASGGQASGNPPAPAPATDQRDPEETLARVYALYPRHEGKSRGLAKLRQEIKAPGAAAEMLQAVVAAASKFKAEGREPRFIPMFSTWVSSWRDYLDPAVAAPVRNGNGRDISRGSFIPDGSTVKLEEDTRE